MTKVPRFVVSHRAITGGNRQGVSSCQVDQGGQFPWGVLFPFCNNNKIDCRLRSGIPFLPREHSRRNCQGAVLVHFLFRQDRTRQVNRDVLNRVSTTAKRVVFRVVHFLTKGGGPNARCKRRYQFCLLGCVRIFVFFLFAVVALCVQCKRGMSAVKYASNFLAIGHESKLIRSLRIRRDLSLSGRFLVTFAASSVRNRRIVKNVPDLRQFRATVYRRFIRMSRNYIVIHVRRTFNDGMVRLKRAGRVSARGLTHQAVKYRILRFVCVNRLTRPMKRQTPTAYHHGMNYSSRIRSVSVLVVVRHRSVLSQIR